MSNVLLVVQARVESTRFPSKILAPLCGQPMLLWELQRLSALPYPLVVACPDTSANAAVAALCERHGYVCHIIPGDQQDVLGRFAKVAALYPEAEHIVRLCGDTPLLDSKVVQDLVLLHLETGEQRERSHAYTGLAREWGDGVADCEIFTREALLLANRHATAVHHREHINPYFWENPTDFNLAHLPCPFDLSWLRCSVDTPEDLRYVELILTKCLDTYGFGFGWREVWWTGEQDSMLREYMARRPMNSAYVAQVGSGKRWEEIRYGV